MESYFELNSSDIYIVRQLVHFLILVQYVYHNLEKINVNIFENFHSISHLSMLLNHIYYSLFLRTLLINENLVYYEMYCKECLITISLIDKTLIYIYNLIKVFSCFFVSLCFKSMPINTHPTQYNIFYARMMNVCLYVFVSFE